MRRLLPILVLVLLLGLQALASHQSSIPGPLEITHPWDKLMHLSFFLILGLVTGWALDRKVAFGWLLAALVGVGVLDEFHQSFVPGREVSAGDLAADALGAALGLVICRGLRGPRPFVRE